MNYFDDWSVKKPAKKKNKADFNQFIQRFMGEYQHTKVGKELKIKSIVKECMIEKRRIYDFMNVLVECGICIKIDTHRFIWNGIESFETRIKEIALEYELKSFTTSFDKILSLPLSPPIGVLATHFIGCFTFLGMRTLNIRDVAVFLAEDETKTKQVLRRLYLVAYILEHIGIIRHTDNTGDYTFIYKFDVERAFEISIKEMRKKGQIPSMSVFYIINRIGPNVLNETLKERKRQYEELLHVHSLCMDNTMYKSSR